jgi:hypothetical protein
VLASRIDVFVNYLLGGWQDTLSLVPPRTLGGTVVDIQYDDSGRICIVEPSDQRTNMTYDVGPHPRPLTTDTLPPEPHGQEADEPTVVIRLPDDPTR